MDHFSSFLWITRFLWRKREKVHNSHHRCFPFLQVWTYFHYDQANNKEEKRSMFTTINHDDPMCAEEPFPWNVLVLQLFGGRLLMMTLHYGFVYRCHHSVLRKALSRVVCFIVVFLVDVSFKVLINRNQCFSLNFDHL